MITYRAPRRDEAAVLAALGRKTFVETFGHLYAPEDLSYFLRTSYDERAVAAQLSSDRFVMRVAEDAGDLIGFCKLGLDMTLDYDSGSNSAIELKQLYVFAAYHGSGVGQTLMDWAIAEATARKADELVLSVWSQNAKGHRFYQRNGFRWVGDTYFMVGNHRDDEYLYMRPMR